MITMYSASVPVLKRALTNLAAFLKKGEANALARAIDPAVFVQAHLAPDMFPLVKQVQIAADMAKGGVARLAGVEAPKFEDTEKTFEDLYARIERTLAFIDSVHAEQIDGSEKREIKFAIGAHQFDFTGQDYLTNWVLPNVFFHVTTAYNILRHNGVDVGKRDFLGG